MPMEKLLAQHKPAIIKRWFAIIIDTYPADTAKFLKSQQNPFANPVGRTIHNSLEALFEHLIEGLDRSKAARLLDPIIRIRAVQDLAPSQATAFIFALKGVLRETSLPQIEAQKAEASFVRLENQIDQLGLVAFDVYMQCREKLNAIKANEIKNKTFRVLKRAGLIDENAADGPGSTKPH